MFLNMLKTVKNICQKACSQTCCTFDQIIFQNNYYSSYVVYKQRTLLRVLFANFFFRPIIIRDLSEQRLPGKSRRNQNNSFLFSFHRLPNCMFCDDVFGSCNVFLCHINGFMENIKNEEWKKK